MEDEIKIIRDFKEATDNKTEEFITNLTTAFVKILEEYSWYMNIVWFKADTHHSDIRKGGYYNAGDFYSRDMTFFINANMAHKLTEEDTIERIIWNILYDHLLDEDMYNSEDDILHLLDTSELAFYVIKNGHLYDSKDDMYAELCKRSFIDGMTRLDATYNDDYLYYFC